jgi:hypothetical protein
MNQPTMRDLYRELAARKAADLATNRVKRN